MPFPTINKALENHPNLKKYSQKAQKAWLSSFNNAIKDHDEGYAFAVAYSVANRIDGKKKASEECMKEIVRKLVAKIVK